MMKKRVKNKKGFTLVELLIAVTILGIILSFSIVIITKLTTKNKETEYRIYSDSLLQASKIYNDEYEEDTFAHREYGCTKIGYSALLDKKLISNVALKGVKCGYTVSGKDSSGVVIRKVKDKYYYEVILFCKDTESANKTKDYVSGVEHDYFYELGEDYCNTEATTDDQPPKVSYRNNKYRLGHFYNRNNLPQPQVKINDNGVGLNNISDINYQWDSKSNKMELLRFTTQKGTGSTAWKNIPLTSIVTSPTSNGVDHVQVTIKNLQDLAGNDHERESWDGEYTRFNGANKIDSDKSGETGTYYIDNTDPVITVSPKVTWTNKTFSITMNVEDKKVNEIRSGIKEVTYKLTSTYADPGNSQTINLKSDNPPESGLNGNYEAARGGNSNTFKKTININKSGNYSLKVTVEDWSGNKVETDYPSYYQFDNIKPVCGKATTNSSTAWVNKDRNVTIECSDQTNLSQCTQNKYSKTFGESYNGKIQIKDKAGNTTDCTVVTRVDKTKPKCTSRGGSSKWRNTSLTIYGDCSDQGSVKSGCKKSVYSKTYSGNNNIKTGYAGKAYDVAGNSIDCTKNQDVHIDVTPPSCSGTSKSNQYHTTGVGVTISCSDSLSKCVKSTYSKSGQKSGGSITIKDNAGNTKSCSYSVSSRTGYRKRTCSTCKECKKAGCKKPDSCTSSKCCGTYTVKYSSNCKKCGESCDVCQYQGDGHTDTYSCNCKCKSCSKTYSKTCTDECCGCLKYNPSCPDCGCDKWGSWNASGTYYPDKSCSPSKNKVECQSAKVYY